MGSIELRSPGSRPSKVALGPGAPRLWPSPPDRPPSAVPAGLAAERRFDRNNSTTNCSFYDPVVSNIWEVKKGRAVANFSCEGIIYCCAMTRDGSRIIAGEHTGRVHFFRLEGAGVANVDRVDPAGDGHIP